MLTITKNHVVITGYASLDQVISIIKGVSYKDEINLLREYYQGDNFTLYRQKKERLRAFIPSGKYEGGIHFPNLLEYSHLLCLDFDNIPRDSIISVKKIACAVAYTRACFISPSGCGLKIICRVNTGAKYHKVAYQQLGKYYSDAISYDYDEKCSNINRLCYFSHDSYAYYDSNSAVYQVDLSWHLEQVSLFQTLPPSKGQISIANTNVDLIADQNY